MHEGYLGAIFGAFPVSCDLFVSQSEIQALFLRHEGYIWAIGALLVWYDLLCITGWDSGTVSETWRIPRTFLVWYDLFVLQGDSEIQALLMRHEGYLGALLVHLSRRLKCTIVITRFPSLTFHIFDFSSETTEQNSTKLDRKQEFNILY